MLFLLAAACTPGEGKLSTGSTTTPTDPTVTSSTSTPTPTKTDTTTPPTTTATVCDVDPDLEITKADPSQPWHENELRIDLTASKAAAVAVACTLRDDPAEVHLIEDATSAKSHELRIGGLLADSDYDCVAAATCPATASPLTFSVHTEPETPGMVEIETTDYGGGGSEYVLFNQSKDCDYQNQRLNVVDRDGRLRWWYSTPQWVGPSVEFRYHGNNQFEWGGGWDPNPLGRPRQLDLFDGEIYDSAVALPDAATSDFHHDGKQLPDGRLLTLERITIDDGGFGFDGFRVRRVDPTTSTVDFDYSSQRGYDEGFLPGGWGDPWHANWVDIVDETLYVSLCNLHEVMAFDVATGDHLWTFGAGGDFDLSDIGGNPLGDGQYSQCQHGLEYTADDRLMVYDNGTDRGYSRVTEYQLDTTAMTATLDWTWTEDDWWETTLGDADYLDSGHVLVDMGHSDCFSSNPGDRSTIVEFDPVSGDKNWQLRYVPQDLTAYRADWADPCELFANALYCPDVADRLAELDPVLNP
jgi:hypothetical protein